MLDSTFVKVIDDWNSTVEHSDIVVTLYQPKITGQ